MTPREIIIANIECSDSDRIGFNFTGVESEWDRWAYDTFVRLDRAPAPA